MAKFSVGRFLTHALALVRAARSRCLAVEYATAKTRLIMLAVGVSVAGGTSVQSSPIHGTVVFTAGTTVTTSQTYLTALVVADFNNDGRPDLAAASKFSNRIAWYENLGGGAFGAGSVISTALVDPTSIFAADLDNDQLIDLACASEDGKISWFRNVGGNPSELRVVTTNAIGAKSVFVANVDGQGLPDLLSTSWDTYGYATTSKIAWYRNLGNGNFGTQNVISSIVQAPIAIRAADLDGDGVTDFVVIGSAYGAIEWFKGSLPSGNPQFTRFTNRMDTGRYTALGSAIADIDGDGWPDVLLAATQPPASQLTWFKNESHVPGATDDFFSPRRVISGTAPGAYAVAVADLNSDGKPDAVAAIYGGSDPQTQPDKVGCYLNGGASNNFNFIEVNIPSANDGSVAVATGDFNQDGVIDVVSGSEADGKVVVFINEGGQCALATNDTAPAALTEGRQDDILRIAVSNRGIAGDNNARLFSIALDLETSPGVAMTTAQANLLIDRVQIYRDANGSNVFEAGIDTLVGSVTDLVLAGGLLTVPITPANPADAQIAPGNSRSYFVVAKIGGTASAQIPNTIRMTHRSKGGGRTVLKDATTGTALTVELAGNTIVSSGLVTPQPAHTYTDFSYIYFDGSAAPGAGPLNDFDLDGTLNLTEFAFGTDPALSSPASMIVSGTVPGSMIIQRGLPTIAMVNPGPGVSFEALFCRRKDPLSGLTYTVQFASDLESSTVWENSTAIPTEIADDGVIQAMSVPFPLLLSNSREPRFFRVAVTSQ